MPSRSEVKVITPGLLRDWALPVPAGGKESRGTVLVVGGSRFTPGAVLLAGVAALRAGAGVLQLAAAESTAATLSIQVPEALVVGLPETADGAVAADRDGQLGELVAQADVVAARPRAEGDRRDQPPAEPGPGRGPAAARHWCSTRTRSVRSATHRTCWSARAGPWCSPPTSPRPGTCSGGTRATTWTPRRPSWPSAYEAVVSLYGHVAAPDGRGWREESGDAGLGTSGSGDVLAGLLAGLLSRGADPAQAACWGSFAHAVSGQRLIPRYGRIGFLARELLDEIPRTLAMV